MKFVPATVSRFAHRQVLSTQKHSPTLLFGAGVVGVVGTIVLASKATLKLEDIVVEAQVNLIKVNEFPASEKYTEEDRQKDKILVYLQSGSAIVKLYGPALGLGVVSIAALAGSNRILTKRNAGLTAAYTSLDKAFKGYRNRVIEEIGEERERDIYEDAREVEVIDPKTGKKKKIKQVSGKGGSPYARVFDQHAGAWKRDPEVNMFTLSMKEKWANDLLRIQGHVFLNEVHDMLGLSRTEEGAVCGWIYDGDGDGFISFGIFDHDIESGRRFVNGDEHSVWLDFNVDGPIFKLLGKNED